MFDAPDESDRVLGDVRQVRLEPPSLRRAIVARLVAVVRIKDLAKVREDLHAATVGLVEAVLHDAPHVVLVVLLLLSRCVAFVDESVEELSVVEGVVEDADGGLAVSACSSGFL